MYEFLKRLYLEGKVSEEALEAAVVKGWINKIEKIQIISSKQEP